MATKVKGINLLPKEYLIAQRIVFYQKIISVAVVLEVLCFVGFVAMPPKKEVRETQDQLLALQSQMNSERYAGVNKTLNELETAKANIEKWMAQYTEIKMDGYISDGLLDQLVARIPAGTVINNLSINDAEAAQDGTSTKTITLQGESEGFEQAISYLSVLETIFSPESITHTISQGKEGVQYTFEITRTFETTSGQSENDQVAEAEAALSGGEDN